MYQELIIKLLLSAFWGGIIGAEREYHSKSAGFRTMILISISSCILTILSIEVGHGISADRIAANIVTGIGFLGAGVIFRNDNKVNGITTGASIWAVAALGITIGVGNYFLALAGGILLDIILALMPKIEKLISKLNQLINYKIDFNPEHLSIAEIEQIFKAHKIKFMMQSQAKEGKLISITWSVSGSSRNQHHCSLQLMENAFIKKNETY